MDSRLLLQKDELYRRTDEVLHYVWDPIGISSIPQARDEYYGYLMQVCGLLKSGANAATIAERLMLIATEEMGLQANRAGDLKAAEILVAWREAINERSA